MRDDVVVEAESIVLQFLEDVKWHRVVLLASLCELLKRVVLVHLGVFGLRGSTSHLKELRLRSQRAHLLIQPLLLSLVSSAALRRIFLLSHYRFDRLPEDLRL